MTKQGTLPPTRRSAVSATVNRFRQRKTSKICAAVTDPSADQRRLVRLDGTTVSSPIAIGGTSTSNVRFEWQP
jgi:hypothetical protein